MCFDFMVLNTQCKKFKIKELLKNFKKYFFKSKLKK